MRFAAIDFETANEKRSSICAAGLAIFQDGEIVKKKKWLISPIPNRFEAINIFIHGIRPEDVRDAPQFPAVWDEITNLLGNDTILIAHNAQFDMSCIKYAMTAHGLPWPSVKYGCTRVLASALITSLYSYGIIPVADYLWPDGYSFDYHDPIGDAECAGKIFLELVNRSGLSAENIWESNHIALGEIFPDKYTPCGKRYQYKPYEQNVNANANSDNAFYGKTVVFTGELDSMRRLEAFEMVNKIGGFIGKGVTKETNYLVVGNYNHRQLRDALMSAKLSKAYALIQKGKLLEIITEDDFLRIISIE